MSARFSPFTRGVLLLLCVSPAMWAARADRQAPPPTTFAALIERLSEAGGDFGGDNLISNEQSYFRWCLRSRGSASAGAYVGVGPDQNFTYIAEIRPAAAFLIDIRRDNLLLHLLFKALFSLSSTRVEYLSLLTGRAPPAAFDAWRAAEVGRLVEYIDATPPLSDSPRLSLQSRVEKVILSFGVPLSASDKATIDGFHREFMRAGLSLVFQARGQPPQDYYPSLRDLLLERDPEGRQLNFLATEAGFQYVRSLQARDLVVPVVGDVAGNRAMRRLAAHIAEQGQTLSAFYISNVEQYLFQQRRFPDFAENLARFPLAEGAAVIRSVFPSGIRLQRTVPHHYSSSLTQPIARMLADVKAERYLRYSDLVFASLK